MYAREFQDGVSFAKEQVAQERKVIESFKKSPTNENFAKVVLNVSGVENVILIHDQDFLELSKMLLKFNKKEQIGLEGRDLIISTTRIRLLSYVIGFCARIVLSVKRIIFSIIGLQNNPRLLAINNINK